VSRSRKKISILGFSSSESEKKDKRMANRMFRRINKQLLHTGNDLVNDMNEIMTRWEMDKDDKRYVKDVSSKEMRK
jgi:hypothetical protein